MLELLLHTALSERDEFTSKLDANTNSDVRCKSDLGEDVAHSSSNIEEDVCFVE
ncbi:hypothetical protein PC116_g4718 [Phytophthora cactorum]|uniref:Uncharacterized protein n=1 Tax=Phytophthora cactorum TaxID=29920 RepID=A0A8T1LFL9_9STRA|nr:hypothetical protein Pcac1_g22729 [Phytophthora cactorum]KAG2930088.1 hypothetical protein PC114_g2605 [Phytophthora cactorum]KAG2948716.1 hypothetical protein PC117_g5844 [Phytophthora cactorum]KAG2991109.1 hypothetical protein PC119_g18971 [Phytophthora cactorum]KAG3190513.1 hypothetical protein C6341_g1755 [Phytophthora cactorum]